MATFVKKVALITGSTSGIGQATASLIAQRGGTTIIHGQSNEHLQKTLALFKKLKIPEERIHSVLGPIEEEKTQKRLIEETMNKFGRLDILVNNAGVSNKKGSGPLDLSNLDYTFNINARSAFSLTQLAHPHLKVTKGSVVNISSVSTLIGAPILLPSQMSRAAVEQQVRNLAIMYAEDGIRVNGVHVGLTVTNSGSGLGVSESDFEATFKKYVHSNIPMRRMGKSEEIAEVIAFLASDGASYVTGTMFAADGGLSVGPPVDPPKPKKEKKK